MLRSFSIKGRAMNFTLRSDSFEEGQTIPRRFTGEGDDEIPSLVWEGLPHGTQELALICEDPDAPTRFPFVHWIAYKIPPDTMNLPEAMSHDREIEVPHPIIEGKNSFGGIGYGGPLPPEGDRPHHYFFRLYALGQKLDLGPGATKEQLIQAMRGHVLAEAQLMGTYQRVSRRAG